MSPLIFFYIVEWQRPKHVLREFGLMQGIPPTCSIDIELHSTYQPSKPQHDWRLHHEHYVALWNTRIEHIVTTNPIEPHMDYHAPYMIWYHRITRRFITPMDNVGLMRYQATALSTIQLVCITLISCGSR